MQARSLACGTLWAHSNRKALQIFDEGITPHRRAARQPKPYFDTTRIAVR
jgi:hypothetical protein